MLYGKFGLANYIESDKRSLSEMDMLDYLNIIEGEKLSISTLNTIVKHNLCALQTSIWRMTINKNSFYPVNKPSINEYENCNRKLQGVDLSTVFVDLYKRINLWKKYYKEILPEHKNLLNDIGCLTRRFGVKLILSVNEEEQFNKLHFNILRMMWLYLGYNYNPSYTYNFRFFVFTSSIPGFSIEEKQQYIESNFDAFKFSKIICLVNNDLSFKNGVRLAMNLGCLTTFVFNKITINGERIKANSKEYSIMLNKACRQNKSSSPTVMPIFVHEYFAKNKESRIIKHFARNKTDTIFI